MQLKKANSIRDALATATCSLLAATAQQAKAEDWKIDSGLLSYSEKDRISVLEPVINGKLSLGDDAYLNLKFAYDTMSGASPNGASATDKAQTFSSPSGRGSYSVPANTLPTRAFSDQRVAGSVDWEKPLTRTLRSTLGASASTENDYSSLGISTNFAWDLNRKLTTLNLGVALNADQIAVHGTIPTGMTATAGLATTAGTGNTAQAATVTKASGPASSSSSQSSSSNRTQENEVGEGGEGPVDTRNKNTSDLMFGVTQVLSRRLLTQLNYSYGQSSGYLTDPYKVLSVVDPLSGETTGYRYEKRPETRTRQSLYWKGVLHLPQDVLHLSYRYYWDDWGIVSHTMDLSYRFELGGGFYLAPHLRRDTQTAADFYRHSLVDGSTMPQYASADYRLAAMQSNTYGFRLGLVMNNDSELGLRAEYMQQTGDSHPADAIGVQRSQDLYPGLQAYIFSLTYSTKF